jgi:glutamine amidotransferase
LGIIPGSVKAIVPQDGLKVPQIGWNSIRPAAEANWASSLLGSIMPGTMFYFVHSFTAVPADEGDRLADAEYGGQRISAAVARGSVTGFQFHPEKSGPPGLEILERFLSH